MSEEAAGVEDLQQVLPTRLPRGAERVLAERRRRLTHGGRFLEWMLETLLVRPRSAGDPDAHDVLAHLADESRRVWVLETLYARRLNPATLTIRVGLTDECDVDPDEWSRHEVAPDSVVEPDPVFAALDEVADLQSQLQWMEARRVRAAVAAWRAAQAEEGEPTASNTPYQRGFFTDLASKLKVASTTARTLVHTAADLEAALPQVWAHFLQGRAPWRAMQAVHAELEGLDPAFHAAFDEGALRKLIEVQPTGLPDALRRLRERVQATSADDRHGRAAARRHVRVEPAADGMAWLHALIPAADALALDHQLAKAAVHAAGRPDETRGVGQLRADVLIDGLRQALRRPERAAEALVPGRRGIEAKVVVTIPAMTVLGHSEAPAVLEGYGPIPMRTAMRLAADAPSWIRVLTDPLTGAVVSLGRRKYRPTRDMRTLLRLLDGAARGPGGSLPPGQADVDHAVSYNLNGAGGRTDLDNLALLSRRDHKDKTDGAGDYDLLLDRSLLWRTATGGVVVTRPVDPPEPTPVPPDLMGPDDCPF